MINMSRNKIIDFTVQHFHFVGCSLYFKHLILLDLRGTSTQLETKKHFASFISLIVLIEKYHCPLQTDNQLLSEVVLIRV